MGLCSECAVFFSPQIAAAAGVFGHIGKALGAAVRPRRPAAGHEAHRPSVAVRACGTRPAARGDRGAARRREFEFPVDYRVDRNGARALLLFHVSGSDRNTGEKLAISLTSSSAPRLGSLPRFGTRSGIPSTFRREGRVFWCGAGLAERGGRVRRPGRSRIASSSITLASGDAHRAE